MAKIKQIDGLQNELDNKLEIFSLLSPQVTIDNDDDILFYDTSAGVYKTITYQNLISLLPSEDTKLSVDADATPDYLGATSSSGVLRTGSLLTYTDGGNFVTIDVNESGIDLSNCNNSTSAFITASSSDTLTNKSFDANGTGNSISNLELNDFASGVVDNDTTLSSDSDLKISTQKAIKTYVDNSIGANDAMVYKGVLDCSTNPNYPSANTGHTYKVSSAGKIGGVSGVNVEVGDMVICLVDGSSGGDQATVGANWNIIQVNIDGAVVGVSSSTDSAIVLFDGTSGKLVKDSTVLISTLENGTVQRDDLTPPSTSASTNFSVTTSQSVDNVKLYTVSINGLDLSSSEIISFSGTTLTLNVGYAVDASDTVQVVYHY